LLLTLSSLSPATKISVLLHLYVAAEDIKKVLGSVQANIKDDDINRVIAALKGKNVHQLIAEGNIKIGGGSAPAVAAKGGDKKDDKKK
jgi:ribosomal protein L12E/L44/L45/RPP1/RPP2